MKIRKFTRNCLSAATVASLFGVNSLQANTQGHAEIMTCEDHPEVIGWASLSERPSNEGVKNVDIVLNVWGGLAPGKHAVHIHETAACEPCGAAGGHFDPGPASFTSPDGNHPYHAGDLVNLMVSGNGIGSMQHTTSRITLSPGPLSIFDHDGSAFIIHFNEDTYCPDGADSGCAGGGRAACGIIESSETTSMGRYQTLF